MTPLRSLPPRWRAISIVGASVLAVLVVAVIGCLILVRTTPFQHAVVRYAAHRMSRQIDIRGPFELNLLSSTPTLTATNVILGNPAWMPPGTTAQIGKLTIVFDFPWPGRQKSIVRLEMLTAKLNLVRDAEGRSNWQWRAPGRPRKAQGMLLRSLHMPGAQVVLNDARRHLQFQGSVTAGDVRGAAAPAPLRIEGSGQLNGRAATFAIDGDPLATASHDRPYGFTFVERSGDAQLRGHGQMLQPFDPGMLDADFAANGASMNELYFLAGMRFPASAPFTFTGKIQRRDRKSTFSNLEARFGRSDVRGTVAMTIVEERPRYDADLSSERLLLNDFGRHNADGSPVAAAATGSGSAAVPAATGSAPAAAPAGGASAASASASRLLSDVKLPLNGLRSRDAVVRYRAKAVESRALSISAFSGRATIDRGVLTATDIHGRFRESHLAGTVKIDVRGDVPQTTLNLTLADLPLEQFARKENMRPPFEGLLQARLAVAGRGNSVHELASSANGELALSMSHGAMRASMAEMTAATLRGLGLTLTKSDAETPVRCGVATFRAREGVLNAERIVVDTDRVLITGAGSIHLGTEALDLTLRGEPTTPRLMRLRAPVNVAGSLRHPSVKMGMKSSAPLPAPADARKDGENPKCGSALASAVPGDAPVKR